MSGSLLSPSPADPDDAELLAAHVAGDPVAFTALVQRHRDRLWAVAVRTLDGDRDEAADAVQDALISALRHADSFRGDSAVTTWLHRIVVNACLDRLRRKASRPAVPLGDRDLPQRRDAHAAVDARLMVRGALAELPAEQREAIVLVDLEDLPVADAAALLGVPVGTVKSRCSRGRVALAAILRGDGPGGGTRADGPDDGRGAAVAGNPLSTPYVAPPGAPTAEESWSTEPPSSPAAWPGR